MTERLLCREIDRYDKAPARRGHQEEDLRHRAQSLLLKPSICWPSDMVVTVEGPDNPSRQHVLCVGGSQQVNQCCQITWRNFTL